MKATKRKAKETKQKGNERERRGVKGREGGVVLKGLHLEVAKGRGSWKGCGGD